MTADPGRAARLAQIAAAHDAWEKTWLPLATLDPVNAAQHGGDYNQHYLDVDPPPGAEDALHAALADPPVQARRRWRRRREGGGAG